MRAPAEERRSGANKAAPPTAEVMRSGAPLQARTWMWLIEAGLEERKRRGREYVARHRAKKRGAEE